MREQLIYGSRLLMLCLTILSCRLAAEEAALPEPHWIILEEVELSAPLSAYTDSWDPKAKQPLKLPGIHVDEKNLIVDLDKAIKASRDAQDLARSQSGWLSEHPWVPPVESIEEVHELPECDKHEVE